MHRRSVFIACAALAVGSLVFAAPAAAQRITLDRTVVFSQLGGPPGTETAGNETRRGPEAEEDIKALIRGSLSSARVSSAHVPRPANLDVAGALGSTGFNGLSHRDQRLADNGRQFSVEPPDQALAVGNGYVLDAVNLALGVRPADGSQPPTVVSLNKFFVGDSAIIRGSAPVFGRFVSDPKAYYDAVHQRWFATALTIATDPASGSLLPQSDLRIAVSQTANPAGAWRIYVLDTTNGSGSTPRHPGCPCFGDQPLLGADANGLYISTNEFPIFQNGFNGAQIYGVSLLDLINGVVPPRMLAFDGLPLAEGPAYSVQPATAPPGVAYSGTAYFMSALDFTGTLDDRIAVWALTHTSWLSTGTGPRPALLSAVIASQAYGQPPDAQQRPGPLPLAQQIQAGAFGTPATEHLPLISANDDRMQQVMFDGVNLWSGLNTVVKPANGPTRVGAAYFIVRPALGAGGLSASIARQGYVAVNQNSVLFPAVAVNSLGQGALGFTLVGQDFYPSAAYVRLSAVAAPDTVRVAAAGAGPEDGFTGYPSLGDSRSARWGDYSAAAVDEAGTLWFATEYIPSVTKRTLLANWGTFIGAIVP